MKQTHHSIFINAGSYSKESPPRERLDDDVKVFSPFPSPSGSLFCFLKHTLKHTEAAIFTSGNAQNMNSNLVPALTKEVKLQLPKQAEGRSDGI